MVFFTKQTLYFSSECAIEQLQDFSGNELLVGPQFPIKIKLTYITAQY